MKVDRLVVRLLNTGFLLTVAEEADPGVRSVVREYGITTVDDLLDTLRGIIEESYAESNTDTGGDKADPRDTVPESLGGLGSPSVTIDGTAVQEAGEI